jgi:hypothetical protein
MLIKRQLVYPRVTNHGRRAKIQTLPYVSCADSLTLSHHVEIYA